MADKKIFTLGELLQLANVLRNLTGITSSEFNFFANQNMFAAENELKASSKEAERVIKLVADFDAEKKELMLKYAAKDAFGSPILIQKGSNSLYDLQGSEEKVAEELTALKTKHAKALADHEKQWASYLLLLDKKCPTFKPYKINRKLVPDTVTTEVFRELFHLID